MSALEHSIHQRGETSYYYAHKKRGEESLVVSSEPPRLIARTSPRNEILARQSIDEYAWADGDKRVR